MGEHGVDADVQALGYLLVDAAGHHQLQHFGFAGRQFALLGLRAGCLAAVDDALQRVDEVALGAGLRNQVGLGVETLCGGGDDHRLGFVGHKEAEVGRQCGLVGKEEVALARGQRLRHGLHAGRDVGLDAECAVQYVPQAHGCECAGGDDVGCHWGQLLLMRLDSGCSRR